MIRRFGWLALILLIPFSSTHSAERIARVAVFATGDIHLNGAAVSLAGLEEEFRSLKADGGAVWYYRESTSSEPPPQSAAVIRLVVKYQLPISMSSKPDFSDYIDKNGSSKPRR
jgi:hypothetical protein